MKHREIKIAAWLIIFCLGLVYVYLMIEAIETDKISILPIRNIFQSSSTIASTRKKSDVPKEQDVIPTQHVMKIYPDSPKKSTIASVISRKVSVKSPSSSKMKIRCSLWEEPTYKVSNLSSQILLDPDKFLYPGLINGPNNQIYGL